MSVRCAEADFRSLAEVLSSLITLIRGETILYVNPAACRLLGRPAEWFVGRRFLDVVHPEDRERAAARARARAAGIPQDKRVVERLVHADGRTIWMDYSIDVVQFEGQATTLVTGHDVSDRLRMEEQYRRSEARLAEAQRIANVGSWEWDVGLDHMVWSDELCRILDAHPSEFGGSLEGYLALLHPDDRVTARVVIEQAKRAGGTFAFEHRIVRRDGSLRTVFGRGEVFRGADGRVVRMAGTGQDITEKKRLAAELQQSEQRFRLAFTHAAIGKAIVAPDGRVLQVNPAACRILGYDEADLLGLDLDRVTHPDGRAANAAFLQGLLSGTAVSGTLEQRLSHKDGRIVRGHVTATVVRDEAGVPSCFIVEFEDVSERWRAVEALRESEERFRNLCTQSPVMLMAFDQDDRVRDVSDFWLHKTGYTRDEVVGQIGWQFVDPASEQRLREAIAVAEQLDQNVIRSLPVRILRRDGSTLDVLTTSVAEVADDGSDRGAICVMVDLTDLQRAEVAVRESAERYRALVEHAPEAIMVLDVEQDRFVDANARAEQLFGWPRERLLQMGPLDFCPEHQADRRKSCEVVEDEHRKVLAGGTAVFEFTHVDAGGRQIVCQTRLSPLPTAGRLLIRASITDVTELKDLQEKVRRAEKLAAVGVLAAGVAHEIGNPLMALSMAAQNLERRSRDEYALGKLGLIRQHIDRISRIVRQMSDLARPTGGRRAPCDLNRVVRAAVDMVRHDRRALDAEIEYALAEPLPVVHATDDELAQVCINLALNAFDAMADNPPHRPRRLRIATEALAGGVRATFRDSGPGVPEAVRTKVFEPFFSTKEAGKGTGLGLSVCLRIVQEHGGTLAIDPEVADGAAFVLTLPPGTAVAVVREAT